MARKDLINILGRAMVDKQFMTRLRENLDAEVDAFLKATGGNLDEKERQFLRDDLELIGQASDSLEIEYDSEGYGGKGR